MVVVARYFSYSSSALILISIIFLISLIERCYLEPSVKPKSDVSDKMSCTGKAWINISPYFDSDSIFEAKGLAPPSPNPQITRNNAIEDALNNLSRLYNSHIQSYSKNFIYEYKDWVSNNVSSEELYNKILSIINSNTLKFVKVDECVDSKTGNWWVLAYTSVASIESAEREATLQMPDLIIGTNSENFRKIIKKQIVMYKQEEQRTDSLMHVMLNRAGNER